MKTIKSPRSRQTGYREKKLVLFSRKQRGIQPSSAHWRIKLSIVAAAASLLLLTTGCFEGFTIRGNGIDGTEMRYTDSFARVKSSGAFDVHISNGDSYEIIVTAETNILPYIETDVIGGTLVINITGIHNVRNTNPMQVYITTPVLDGVTESGSGTITTGFFESNGYSVVVSGSGKIETSVDCHTLNATVSGSGDINLSGISDFSDFKISGSGYIDAFDLEATNCEAAISGSGDIYANVERILTATISGSGSIFYIGNPTINHHISGSGKIINNN